jgi:hypothetical protein
MGGDSFSDVTPYSLWSFWARLFPPIPNFGTLIGNSWNVLERRVSEGVTFYLQNRQMGNYRPVTSF